MDIFRRTPDPDGRDFIILANDDTRLVRHSTEREAKTAAESLALKFPGKRFRVFVATGEVVVGPFAKPNSTLYFVTPHNTLLVAVHADGEGHIARVIVGSGDGKAFTASKSWFTDRLALDLTPITTGNVTTTAAFVPHLMGILTLLSREHHMAKLSREGKVA